jgi:hypothetical protein
VSTEIMDTAFVAVLIIALITIENMYPADDRNIDDVLWFADNNLIAFQAATILDSESHRQP